MASTSRAILDPLQRHRSWRRPRARSSIRGNDYCAVGGET
jgi:hypothetical protein